MPRGRCRCPRRSCYSRTDGFMEWRRVVQETGPQAENIEVISSHFGMMNNPMTLHLVADRLAQPKGVWAPYAGLVLSDLIPNQFLRSMDQKNRPAGGLAARRDQNMAVERVLPPGYPVEWEADVVLRDGSVAHLRPITPA